jgi:HlyD family secretion protein
MMRSLLRHKTLIAAVLVILAVVAMAMIPESIEVDLTTVSSGPLRVTLDEDGETRVRDRFVVSAPVAGRLQRIVLEPGDAVVKGRTVVARVAPAPAPLLDPRTRGDLNAAVDAARAAVGGAIAERGRAATALARARTTLARQQELMKAGAISADALEAAETSVRTAEDALKAAEFTVSRAEYELELARARLAGPGAGGRAVDVVAPVDGVILKRLHESETVVPAGEPILEIGNPQNLEIVADFLSTDAVQIKPGAPVLIEQWGGPDPLNGRVRRVDPSGFMKVSALGVEEQRVNVVIDFVDQLEASELLGDGYRVEIRIVTWESDDVLKLPVSSLFRTEGDWAVFTASEGIASRRRVEIGRRNGLEAEILSGISEGERVIVHPSDDVADGIEVVSRGTL